MVEFDSKSVERRIERIWALTAKFGRERGRYHTYLDEIVSDRYALLSGMQILRDELQFADPRIVASDLQACAADFTVPSVVTTVAHTNCGDRIHQGEAESYKRTIAARFATVSEVGDVKIESFSPTGGGTDDGATLAHVTVAHQIDAELRRRVYDGHAQSFIFVAIDLKTHVGRLDKDGAVTYGTTKESPWREERAACGAIVGTLRSHDYNNPVHRRIRNDLGEENFQYLAGTSVKTDDGVEINTVIAAAIVAVRGMHNTARALAHKEFDARGVGHLTACITVNRMMQTDPAIYLARATAFGKRVRVQGFGLDARKYGGAMFEHDGEPRLALRYGDSDDKGFPISDLY
ncbi:MAG: hypothetical protein KF773_15975 [Deltaproteobacteria bacterium]|nr:hypothetical protein [Deltaproteobacteria bacterium]